MYTMNGSRDALNDEYAAKVWPAILFLSVVMVTGSLGNILVCVVYWFDLSKVNNRFVLALAGIDLVNCLISIPGDIADLRYKYSFGDSYLCPVKSFTATFCSLASASILLSISVERFQKICKPFERQTTLQNSIAAIFISIFLSFTSAIPAAMEKGREAGFVKGVATVECHRKDTSFFKIYNMLLFLLFIVSFLVIVVLYSFMWHRLRKQRYFRNQLRCKTSEDNSNLTTDQVKQIRSENVDSENSNDQSFPESICIWTKSPSLTSTSEQISLELTSKYSDSMSPSQSRIVMYPSKSTSLVSLSKSTSLVSPSKPTSLASTSLEPSPDDNRTGEESSGPNPPLNDGDRGNRTAKMMPISTSTKVDKTTIIMLLVTVVFILSFLPYFCLIGLKDIYPESFKDMTTVQLASYELFYRSHFLNSALNPFIYSFLNRQFREQLGKLKKGLVRKLRRG